MKGSKQPGIRPGKEDGILREPLQGSPAGQGSTAGELALARRCCGKTCWRRGMVISVWQPGARCALIVSSSPPTMPPGG